MMIAIDGVAASARYQQWPHRRVPWQGHHLDDARIAYHGITHDVQFFRCIGFVLFVMHGDEDLIVGFATHQPPPGIVAAM